jgi:TetR/AcrR family transcriptional regulator, transcriptional repressor for nem operon
MARGKHRDKLLDEGLRLFTQHGFTATGVQEITEAGGVPKGSFYNYFDSKEDFALAVLQRYQDQACHHIGSILERQDLTPLGKLRALHENMIEQMAATGFSQGCLAGRLAQEVAGENPILRPHLEHTFSCMRELFATTLREAQRAGELSLDLDIDPLSEFLLLAWQGAVIGAKAAGSARPLRAYMDIAFGQLLRPVDPKPTSMPGQGT